MNNPDWSFITKEKVDKNWKFTVKKNCDLFIMEKQNKNFFKDCCLYAEKLSENSPKTCAKQIWQGLTVNVCHS